MTLDLPTKKGRKMTMNKQELASTIWQYIADYMKAEEYARRRRKWKIVTTY